MNFVDSWFESCKEQRKGRKIPQDEQCGLLDFRCQKCRDLGILRYEGEEIFLIECGRHSGKKLGYRQELLSDDIIVMIKANWEGEELFPQHISLVITSFICRNQLKIVRELHERDWGKLKYEEIWLLMKQLFYLFESLLRKKAKVPYGKISFSSSSCGYLNDCQREVTGPATLKFGWFLLIDYKPAVLYNLILDIIYTNEYTMKAFSRKPLNKIWLNMWYPLDISSFQQTRPSISKVTLFPNILERMLKVIS